MSSENAMLWSPSPERASATALGSYMRWLRSSGRYDAADYDALHEWSVTDQRGFWRSIWDWADVRYDGRIEEVLDRDTMLGARWFTGTRVNYAEHLLRREADAPDATVLHHSSEIRPEPRQMTWGELGHQVRIVATWLRALGVKPGDTVAAVMPNIPETFVAMIATAAIGAVWAAAAPEFGVRAIIDRFAQIKPKVLFVTDGYKFAGKSFARAAEIRALVDAVNSIGQVVWLDYLEPGVPPPPFPSLTLWSEVLEGPAIARADFRFERVPSDHPLWVLFSSGTTGPPKAIVHGHCGMLIEHLKLTRLHLDLGPDTVLFFYTTTGWMMWNIMVANLLTGGASVLYDGSPAWPTLNRLWELAAQTRTTTFGASPTFIHMMDMAGLEPGRDHDLSALSTVIVSGAPATPRTFEWIYRSVAPDISVTSQSGGTEICSAFVGAVPTAPVHAGEIQAVMLGMDVHAWTDDGRDAGEEIGELVVTKAFPSMPLYFVGDPDFHRYHETYFDTFPGVWRHGDFIQFNARKGSIISGRSDSTLNRDGVRIGTAEIYRIVEDVAGVADSLIVSYELPGQGFRMPLFIKTEPGVILDDALRHRIVMALRREGSPRHVPDRIEQVPAIPYTLTAKKMEIPVRRVLLGEVPSVVASPDAMLDPSALDHFLTLRA